MRLLHTTTVLFAALMISFSGISQAAPPYLHAPSIDSYAKHDPKGTTILSNGRLLTPVGSHYPMGRFPYGLVTSRDGRLLFVANDGSGQLVSDWQGAAPKFEAVVPTHNAENAEKRKRHNSGGADFSPDGSKLYWSGGEGGNVLIYDTATREKTGEININTKLGEREFQDSYAVDVKTSASGEFLYVALRTSRIFA